MPLKDGYGLVIGTLNHYVRDPINNYGQYYHENLYIDTPIGTYHCAIDVDSKMSNNGIEWRVVPLQTVDLKGITNLPNGWHNIASNDTSGAIDYIRTSAFDRPGCNILIYFVRYEPIYEALRRAFNQLVNPPWKSGKSIDALHDLELLLTNCKRLYVFGEPFTYGGLGVHNIHQNQGDPAGSQWWAENGIWQDGATIIQRQDNTFVAFLNKFKTQSYNTDNLGHPL